MDINQTSAPALGRRFSSEHPLLGALDSWLYVSPRSEKGPPSPVASTVAAGFPLFGVRVGLLYLGLIVIAVALLATLAQLASGY